MTSSASTVPYRALVVVFLDGGNDGHNCLVPTDGAYGDYQRSRSNLALPRSSLVDLAGSVDGRRLGIHPAMSPLTDLYSAGRLAFVANVGALEEPATGEQVRDGAVSVPPFLLSHPEQVARQQGWTGGDDPTGWGGRTLDALSGALRHPLGGVTLTTSRRLVQGRRRPAAFIPLDRPGAWGLADLGQPASEHTQRLLRMAQGQHANRYLNDYARNLEAAVNDSVRFIAAVPPGLPVDPAFSNDPLGLQLGKLAGWLPSFRQAGYRRQMFLVTLGGFDTHANQRGAGPETQDALLAQVAGALKAFDAALVRAGMSHDVTTLVMSEFGRTLRPGSGGGSEHGWANHWMLMGSSVRGGTVHGRFPSLVLGGEDDGDRQRHGRMVPTLSSDQIGATLSTWLGLEPALLASVYPGLVRFPAAVLPLMH